MKKDKTTVPIEEELLETLKETMINEAMINTFLSAITEEKDNKA